MLIISGYIPLDIRSPQAGKMGNPIPVISLEHYIPVSSGSIYQVLTDKEINHLSTNAALFTKIPVNCIIPCRRLWQTK